MAFIESLGQPPIEEMAAAGWSPGANIAAVVCRMVRDAGAPAINAQLLITPVTDCDFSTPSCTDNGDGYVLTADTMRGFWDHFADPASRSDPRASPVRRSTTISDT